MEITMSAYDELIDFIARGSTSREVAEFKPSPQAQARVSELLSREKLSELSPAEKAELDHYVSLEHILRMAKARAHLLLGQQFAVSSAGASDRD